MKRLAFCVALVSIVSAAHAGDRQLEITIVNMIPDALANEASRQCMRTINADIAKDYTAPTKLGETPLRKAAGKTAGEPFMAWPVGMWKALGEKGIMRDAIALIDCRPDEHKADVLVVGPLRTVTHLELRDAKIDATAAHALAAAILRRGWLGFSP